jgi:hypothetical protein
MLLIQNRFNSTVSLNEINFPLRDNNIIVVDKSYDELFFHRNLIKYLLIKIKNLFF